MPVSERHEPHFPFPSLPESVRAGHSISALALRPFGLYESDLQVDFNQPLRPFLVTDILECCTREVQGRAVKSDFFWRLPVGKRIECLLVLACLETGTEFPFTFCCLNEECGVELEIEISVAEIAAQQEDAYATEWIALEVENEKWTLRRPTAGDQREWLSRSFADEPSAVKAMVRTLLVDETGKATSGGAIPSNLVHAVSQAMDQHDPLVNFSVAVNCSSCGIENSLEIDLEEISLRQLRRAQMRLLSSVHTLATHYHWSEPEIFSVPYERRARYLNLIQNEKNQ